MGTHSSSASVTADRFLPQPPPSLLLLLLMKLATENISQRNTVPSCRCGDCNAVNAATVYLKETTAKNDIMSRTDIRVGDRVLIRYGSLTGVVRYVGDLDSQYTDAKLYVGIKLDDPYGDHDGIVNGKRYFKCSPKHGMLVAIEEVSLLHPRQARSMPTATSLPTSKSSKKMLNRQISKCYGRNVKQLLDTQKQKFSSKMIPKKLSSLALSSNKGHINKPQNMTPGLCYNTGLGSQIRGSNCNLSLLPSSGSPSDLPLPPTPHPCKTRKTIPRQHLYEEAIELRSHKLTEELLARRGVCFRLIHLEPPTQGKPISPPTPIAKMASSYSRRLLSGIPISMADNDPDDNPELLCKLMHQWGNNERALKMTSTFQMLIEGRRKGQKQVAWQKKLDELQKLPSHNARVSHIKEFQVALADYKDKITKREALLRAKEREQTLKSKAQLEKLQAHINEYTRKCSALEEKIKNHRVASQASKVLELLNIPHI